MTLSLLLTGSVILLSLLISKALRHTPLPSLLLFIALGMLFGENGLFHIPFDDYQAVDIICSSALVIIMFYGGFGTSSKRHAPFSGRRSFYRRSALSFLPWGLPHSPISS